MEYVDLGRTGLKVSRLSFGTGTRGWGGRSEQTDLGLDELTKLLRAAYECGVNFWDTADAYGSHPHIARALRGIPRDEVVIATKTTSRSGDVVTRDIERFLKELEVDVLDIVLLHFVSERTWPKHYADAMQALTRAKEQGKVRAVGVSCHSLGALCAAAETDWVDVVLARINSAGVNMDAAPVEVAPVIQRIYTTGKAVYGMKVLGCGRLVDNPGAAIRYVFQLGTVHAVTLGITRRAHLLQDVKLVEELAPLHTLQIAAPIP
jgi:aryl-alcohol dehydrogenase-like predicted oxidoreductase